MCTWRLSPYMSRADRFFLVVVLVTFALIALGIVLSVL